MVSLVKETDGVNINANNEFGMLLDGVNFNRLVDAVALGDIVHNGQYETTAYANAYYRLDPLWSNNLNALSYVFSLTVA